MQLLMYVREGIILLSSAINVEENHKENSRSKDNLMISINMDRYDDVWKQIHY